MARMIRKQFYIESQQEALLKRLVQETGMTEAELVRQAIDRQMRFFASSRRDLRAWQEEAAFIARLIEQGPVSGKRIWRREELHER